MLWGCATTGTRPAAFQSDSATAELPSPAQVAAPPAIQPAISPAHLEQSGAFPGITQARYQEMLQVAAPIELPPRTTGAPAVEFDTLATLDTAAAAFVASSTDDSPAPANSATSSATERPSEGQERPSEGQPIDFFVQQALASHPRIQAARQRVAAAANVIPQVQALPDPNFSNTFWPLQDQALQTAAGRIGNQMALNQQIPYPEKLRAKARVASREVQIAQAEVDAIAREITESVRLAYYEVWFNTRAIEILEDSKALVDDLTDVVVARSRAGGAQQDVLRVQLETDRLDEQLINQRKQKAVAQADLAVLVRQPVELIPETIQELDAGGSPADMQTLSALAEQCNPALRGLAWEIARDRERQQLACLQKYPDFNVGFQWGLVSDNNNVVSPVANGHDNLSFTFGTTLPIWREKISAGIREAEHRTASTTQRLAATRDEIAGKLRRLMAQADALIEQRDIYRERIVPRTEATLELAIADYRGARTDFYTLIETYRELLMFESQLARIEASLAGVVAQIDRAVGCPIAE